jgi:hypothetical protein
MGKKSGDLSRRSKIGSEIAVVKSTARNFRVR